MIIHVQAVHNLNVSVGLWLLINPVELRLFIGNDVFFLEPQGDFLLGIFDAIGAMADVAAHVLGSDTLAINETGGAIGTGKGVGPKFTIA